jgi:hypothetical protein
MRWAHLPVAGGLYDQSPELLEMFQYILAERSREEIRKQREQERKNQNSATPQMMRQAAHVR